MCQFNKYHVFITRQDRNKHEKECEYYLRNTHLHNIPQIEWDRADGYISVMIRPQIQSEIKNNSNQIPPKFLKRVEDQKTNFQNEQQKKIVEK